MVFQPSGREGRVNHGISILEAARQLGEDIESVCGGKSTCGKCVVKTGGRQPLKRDPASQVDRLSPPTEGEIRKLSSRGFDASYRLACEARILGDVEVTVPETSRRTKQVMRKASIKKTVPVKPALRKYYVELMPPSLDDLTSDADRLIKGLCETFRLKNLTLNVERLSTLPDTLRSGNWKATALVWMDKEIVKVEPGYVNGLYGAAVDIGTTTVAAYLCELETGRVIGEEAILNPQIKYGEDVITRINYAMNQKEGLADLHESITEGIKKLLATVARQAHISPSSIVEITVVGNTAMHHIFLGLDPRWLARSPFTPSVTSSLDIKYLSNQLGLENSANVHALPVVAGFVGADTVGALISEEPYRQEKNILLIDVGTNGEIVLGNRRRLLAASCAMGPAFEGGSISHGMRAAEGAIERVEIDRATLEPKFKVIGSDRWNTDALTVKARGICGSGIIDAAAAMSRVGIIEPNGRFNQKISSQRIVNGNGNRAFIIARADETSTGKAVTVGIDDIRAVQLAKAAMHAGVRILMEKLGITSIDKAILAGAFGSYIRKENALAIGLFPACDLKNVYSVGNAAGEGARLCLINVNKRCEAGRIARQVEYVELTVEPHFQRFFVDALNFPVDE